MVTGEKPDEQVDWAEVQTVAISTGRAARGGRVAAMKIQKCRNGGWYVLGPRILRGSEYRWIIALGWFEIVVRRGR